MKKLKKIKKKRKLKQFRICEKREVIAKDLTARSIEEGVLAFEWCSRKLISDILREASEGYITKEELDILLKNGLFESRKILWNAWEKFCKGRF